MTHPQPGTPERSKEDVAMMSDPDRWPLGAVLPVKRRPEGGGFYECALVAPADDEGRLALIRATLYELEGVTAEEGLRFLDGRLFLPEELVADGWMVD